jgi:hypothetical protein
MRTGDRLDARRHRGREQHRLALGRGLLEDRFDVFGEAHVEHLVGLVEHDDLHGGEVERLAPDVVQGPARGRDHHVDALLQRPQLPDDRLAAVDRHDPGAEVAPVPVDRLGDLHRQLTGGHEHQRHRATRLVDGIGAAVGGEPLQDRQRERRGLAGAGGGLAEQVAAFQQRRDRLALDRGGLLVAEGRQRGDQLRGEVEVLEGDGVAVGRNRSHAARQGSRSPT